MNQCTISLDSTPPVKKQETIIVWFRGGDLRLHDNAALLEACRLQKKHPRCYRILTVFLYTWEEQEINFEGGVYDIPGGASRVWLSNSSNELAQRLRKQHHVASLFVKANVNTLPNTEHILTELCAFFNCRTVVALRRYEYTSQKLDTNIAKNLSTKHGIHVEYFAGYLLHEPEEYGYLPLDYDGRGHFGTLTPLAKRSSVLGVPARPAPAPKRMQPIHKQLLQQCRQHPFVSCTIMEDASYLLPARNLNRNGQDWRQILTGFWKYGEQHALAKLDEWCNGGESKQSGLVAYQERSHRVRADIEDATSKLSPYIQWGELTVRDVYWAVKDSPLKREEKLTFPRRLVWRDLAHHHLWLFPQMAWKSIRTPYDDMSQWYPDKHIHKERGQRWQSGTTGWPLVDAGMRQLEYEGWLPQSIRMVQASTLIEVLGVDWRIGEQWYRDQLVDASPAINSMMWQNAGRSGIDQWNWRTSPESGITSDPQGEYIKKWLPELKGVQNKFLRKPWTHPLSRRLPYVQQYPRLVSDIPAAYKASEVRLLHMRADHQEYNDEKSGYDVIPVRIDDAGKTGFTRLFTRPGARLNASTLQMQRTIIKKKKSKKSGGKHNEMSALNKRKYGKRRGRIARF